MSRRLDAVAEVSRFGPFLVERLGSMGKAVKVAHFVASWGIASDDLALGRAMTLDEYCRYWKVSLPTAYRGLRLFHDVWPRERNPEAVWRSCRRHVRATELDQACAQLFTVRAVS